MFRHLRLLAAPALILGLTAFQDPAGHYTIEFPAGWEPMTTLTAPLSGVKAPDGNTNCNAQASPVPALASMTQDQINAQLSAPMDAAAWASVIGLDVSKIEVVDAEARPIDGKFLQIATITFAQGAMNSPIPVKARMGVMAVPGFLINGGCYTTVEAFDGMKDTFEATVSSMRPM